jgi:hypothetical protein
VCIKQLLRRVAYADVSENLSAYIFRFLEVRKSLVKSRSRTLQNALRAVNVHFFYAKQTAWKILGECETSGALSGVAEDSGILGCEAVSLGGWFPALRRITLPFLEVKLTVFLNIGK